MPNDPHPASTLRRWRTILVLGIVLATGPALGLLGMLFGMLHSFQTIERMKAPTPDDLATGVNLSVISSLVGFLAGAIGALLIVLACIELARIRSQEPSEVPSP